MKRRIIIALGLCGFGSLFLPESFVFAEDTSFTQHFVNFFHLIISLLSWLWILIASVAGKLMTNEFVYGEFIHLDQALYKLRNITRTFANFMIGAMFLWTIISYFRNKQENAGALVKKIVGFIAAGVAVQASWFLVGAVIDISTILTASIGGFPSMILEQDKELQAVAQTQMITIPKKTHFDLTQDGTSEAIRHDKNIPATSETEENQTVDMEMQEVELAEFLDLVVPRHDSVSGPLVYIGLSVFHVQDYLSASANAPKINSISDVLATMGIKFAILVLFTFAMVILLVINVIRIVYLWLFIAFSPILIVLAILKMNDAESSISDSLKGFKLTSLIYLIFTPVLYVAYMGIMLIMIVTMQKIISSGDRDGTFVTDTVTVTQDTIGVGDSSLTVNGDIWPSLGGEVGETAANTMTDLLLFALTMVMIRGLVYLAAKSGPDTIAKKTAEGALKLGKDVAKATPLGKIDGTPISFNSTLGRNGVLNETVRQYTQANKQTGAELRDQIDELIGAKQGFSNSDYQKLENRTGSNDTFGTFGNSKFVQEFKSMVDGTKTTDNLTLQNYSMLSTHLDSWVKNNADDFAKSIRKIDGLTNINKDTIKEKVKEGGLKGFMNGLNNEQREKFISSFFKDLTGKDYSGSKADKYEQFIRQSLK